MRRMNVVLRHCRSASARRRAWRLFSVLGGIVIWGSALLSPSLAGQQSEASETAAALGRRLRPAIRDRPFPFFRR